MSNYLISNAAGLLGATISAKADFKSTILVEPSAAVEVSQDLAKVALPSLKEITSQVKIFESYGITTTIEPSSRTSIHTGQEVPS